MSKFFQKRPGGGGICHRCKHDLRVTQEPGSAHVVKGHRLFRGESDGHVYCSNTTCEFFDKPYKPGKQANLGNLLAHPDVASLSQALGPIVVGRERAN